MLGKDLELIRISWKAKRLNFGELETVTSCYTWHDSLQRAFVMSRHHVTTRHKDHNLEDSRLSSFYILIITFFKNIQIRLFKLL